MLGFVVIVSRFSWCIFYTCAHCFSGHLVMILIATFSSCSEAVRAVRKDQNLSYPASRHPVRVFPRDFLLSNFIFSIKKLVIQCLSQSAVSLHSLCSIVSGGALNSTHSLFMFSMSKCFMTVCCQNIIFTNFCTISAWFSRLSASVRYHKLLVLGSCDVCGDHSTVICVTVKYCKLLIHLL